MRARRTASAPFWEGPARRQLRRVVTVRAAPISSVPSSAAGTAVRGRPGGGLKLSQVGKFIDFYLKDDVADYFGLPDDLPELPVQPVPLPEWMLDEMWAYSDWHRCFSGDVERKEERGRRMEFVHFTFERFAERYKFFARARVAMRSRHVWGQVHCCLSYPRGHFAVVHFVSDFAKWNTTETVGQYPALWPKPHRTAMLFLDMAAYENYKLGMGPPRWGVVTDGFSWRIIEQYPGPTGAWDGRQQFRESSTFEITVPFTKDQFRDLCAWLNHIFQNHAPINSASGMRQWEQARRDADEPPARVRRKLQAAKLRGLE
eukprot:TRINITY_DN26434_c0_g1_i2.p1 TRINITY_DN26434_c0_g1~~TRINITY_DN26434_c0_g1_i2.p1  ORF type:complete len:342 (+),score=93.28 TRINITY_DN26434_c0_g1_i2:79-1026(+)